MTCKQLYRASVGLLYRNSNNRAASSPEGQRGVGGPGIKRPVKERANVCILRKSFLFEKNNENRGAGKPAGVRRSLISQGHPSQKSGKKNARLPFSKKTGN